MLPVSLYLHIPFCTHRCGYCDFNTYAGLEALMPAYADALQQEARLLAQATPERLKVHTIFFGGGTPSLLPPKTVAAILQTLAEAYDLAADAEITLEANPGTLDRQKLQGLRAAGINRLSFGVQSSSPEELRLLEREHDFIDVIQAVECARQTGFDNLNLDWIFGLPGQSLHSWQRNVELAIQLAPEHLSLYALTIEHGTPFKDMAARGLLPDLDADLAADMYELAADRLAAAGYAQYEISNWARRDSSGGLLACKHNLQYWRSLPYAGLGAGAHGFLGGKRTANVLAPAAYIKRLREGAALEFPRTPATVNLTALEPRDEMGEVMMMGLRLIHEGVSQSSFSQRFGQSLDDVYGREIRQLTQSGLLERMNGEQAGIRLSQRGRLLGNQVFVEFI
ncbi:MAG: radical SAM family heme chaperone HemW [Anaerolineales bacterium]|nr:radical SAM family heme chaperone HemW [Anaerolineales bacterium]MCW5856318.1 radical SAM family heme chaperone HemW [Anaerolineales bacterium]